VIKKKTLKSRVARDGVREKMIRTKIDKKIDQIRDDTTPLITDQTKPREFTL